MSTIPYVPTERAAIYGRVSTSKQDTAQQELRCNEYLAWRKFAIATSNGRPAIFLDDDVSGTIPIWERRRGKELRDCLGNTPRSTLHAPIKHLIVLKLDRLGRSAVDLLNTVQFLDSIGVVLHIVDLGGDSLSTQGPSGRLMITVLAGMAEYERELIRGRIQDKLHAKRQRGELTGTVPYGWTAVETGELTAKGVKVRRLDPNPDEQRWILFMQQLRQAGHGYHTIAKRLNESAAPTKQGRGTIMKLRICDRRRSIPSPGGEEQSLKSEKRFTTGRWQAGNVAKVLNNDTVKAWLASKAEAA